MKVGAPFELVWRNDELTDPPGKRPDGFRRGAPDAGPHHRSSIRRASSPSPLERHGEVSFELEAQGNDVLLTLIHRRLPNRNFMLGVSGGWHAHLDVLVARVRARSPRRSGTA